MSKCYQLNVNVNNVNEIMFHRCEYLPFYISNRMKYN